jgi:hypothetical protein
MALWESGRRPTHVDERRPACYERPGLPLSAETATTSSRGVVWIAVQGLMWTQAEKGIGNQTMLAEEGSTTLQIRVGNRFPFESAQQTRQSFSSAR